jgi:hypothetical protein
MILIYISCKSIKDILIVADNDGIKLYKSYDHSGHSFRTNVDDFNDKSFLRAVLERTITESMP